MKNFRVLMMVSLLLAPVTAQAASVGSHTPTSGSTVLSDAEMDKAHGKDAPYELAAPVLLIPGIGEAALAGAAVLGAAFLVYKGGEAIYNAVTSNGSGSTVDTAKNSRQSGKEAATNIPGWAKGQTGEGSTPAGRAKSIMDDKYGEGNWGSGNSATEYSQIKKNQSRQNSKK